MFQDYIISKNVFTFELKIIKNYISFIRKYLSFDIYQLQFLEYRIISSAYNHLFPHYSKDYSSFGDLKSSTQNYKFGQLLYTFIKNPELKLNDKLEEPEEIEVIQTLTEAFQTSNSGIKKLLKNEQNRAELDFLLGKVFDNAYTTFGNLTQNIDKENEAKKVPLLFKYDERFYAPRKAWKEKILEKADKKYLKEEEKKKFIEKETEKLTEIIDRQPFSKALTYYKNCIQQIGRDYFTYIIVPSKFPAESQGWKVEKFINKKVIPKAREFQKELNKEILIQMPYLKGTLKRKLDANYYIIYFNNSDFKVFAEAKTIPKPFKNIIIKTIIESEDADNKILSQLIYIKQVINSLSLSGLLFSEEQNVQDIYLKYGKKIIKEANKEGIQLGNINQIASLGNQSSKLEEIAYKIIYEKDAISKRSRNFKSVQKDINTIQKNAQSIIEILHKLRNSPKTKSNIYESTNNAAM